jgi:hypothetical protein
VGAAPTEDEALDRTVAAVRRDGLVGAEGRVLRPADVVVFRYQPPPTPEAGTDT